MSPAEGGDVARRAGELDRAGRCALVGLRALDAPEAPTHNTGHLRLVLDNLRGGAPERAPAVAGALRALAPGVAVLFERDGQNVAAQALREGGLAPVIAPPPAPGPPGWGGSGTGSDGIVLPTPVPGPCLPGSDHRAVAVDLAAAEARGLGERLRARPGRRRRRGTGDRSTRGSTARRR